MTREVALRAGTLAWLTLVWILLWGNVSVANIVGGLIVAILITVLLPLPRVPVEGRIHPWSIVKLIGLSLWYAAQSSAQVAWLAVRPGPPPVTGVLRCRLAIKSDLVLTLCVDVLNLIPGTMVLEVDQVKRMVYVHVLDVSTDRAVRQFYRTVRRLEALFIASFERDSEWTPSPLHDAVDPAVRRELP
ncbi:Na+/H+ antiporter subunit E [Rhodococcus sp. NPDC003318]|uniref:Na+/H+ antiporter subunit E n=1 Tax=Rhodococcus sp. NPDC003318 TaxID=3364503 RepID=UPI0036876394